MLSRNGIPLIATAAVIASAAACLQISGVSDIELLSDASAGSGGAIGDGATLSDASDASDAGGSDGSRVEGGMSGTGGDARNDLAAGGSTPDSPYDSPREVSLSEASKDSPTNPCSAGLTDCPAGCVDTDTNQSNCGECGNACPVGASCSLGTCRCQNHQAPCCDSCAVDCQRDRRNCGSCGNDCGDLPNGSVHCFQGECAYSCNDSYTLCPDGCFNLQYDDQHCAACDTSCPNGQQCSEFHCCDTPKWYCNGACADVGTDPNNCGACGNVCPSTLKCYGQYGCLCTANADCTAGGGVGTCYIDVSEGDTAGFCSCADAGALCAQGQRCLAGGTCG
jgi:hypothetical protein